MTLALRRFTTPEEFAEAAMLFLLQHEAEHCLPIGLVAQTMEHPDRWAGPVAFASVERDGVPVVASIRTPPHNPIVSRVVDADAIPLLVGLYLDEPDIPGVLAPVEAGSLFAEEWARRTGDAVALAMSERIYMVERVQPVLGVPGQLRRATEADRALLIAWVEAFAAEVFGERLVREPVGPAVDARLASAQGGFALWEDGDPPRPVCLIGYGGPTPDGIRIGPVYTPPEHRRRGYASAATATLSQQLLDEGRRFCVLFTDLDNPTSNHIYREIGYEPVADVAIYRFTR